MTPDEAAREIADLRSRVQRLEDALDGLLMYRPRLVDGLPAYAASMARERAIYERAEFDTWPPGATFGGWR
jgi:hypothetical protein